MPLLWVAIYQLVAALTGALTVDDVGEWYQGLEQAALNPPDFIFPIVWTVLYVMIALAGWIVWAHRKEDGPILVSVFALYTALNWTWSFVFFEFRLVGAAFWWIVLLDAAALFFIWRARTVRPKAALLMVLPLAWTCFAAYLNYAVWTLNY